MLNGIASGNSYPTLTQALLGNLPVTAMASLCVLKLAATVTSYSSAAVQAASLLNICLCGWECWAAQSATWM